MTKYTNKKARIKQKIFNRYAILFIVLLLIGGSYYFVKTVNKTSYNLPISTNASVSNASKSNSEKSSTNLSPPTQAEKNAAHDNQQLSTTKNSTGKIVVTPIITSVNNDEVRAFVSGAIEDGGTCTATYTHESDVVTATSTGFSDVNHITCPAMVLQGPLNIQGTWSVVVTYSSNTYYGQSNPSSIEVK